MASGDGRYGQPDRPWSASTGSGDEAPDLWVDDPQPPPAYYPGTAVNPALRPPLPAPPEQPGWARTASGNWTQQPRHAAEAEWPPREQPFTGQGRRGAGVANDDTGRFRDDPRWHTPPPPVERTMLPGAARAADTRTPVTTTPDSGAFETRARPSRRNSLGRSSQRRPAGGSRSDSLSGRHSARIDGTEAPTAADASYGRVLGLTAAWYTVPALLAAAWLLLLDADRRGTANRELLTNLPWAFTAFVLSLGVAALLRWASIGWRTWTMTFASAVIGAGIATVLHSFSI